MDPADTFTVVFYISKILRIGIVIGVFEDFRRRLRVLMGVEAKPTRLQVAGGP